MNRNLELFKKHKSVFHRLAGGQSPLNREYGFSLDHPIRIEETVGDFELYEYAIVSYFCQTLNADWQIYGSARNVLQMGEREVLIDEIKFRVAHPRSHKDYVHGSMFFDITDCAKFQLERESSDFGTGAVREDSKMPFSGVKSFNQFRKISGSSAQMPFDRQSSTVHRF